MPIAYKIILKDIRRSDQVIFHEVLPLLSAKTNLDWKIIPEGAADAVIVDADTTQGQLSAARFESQGITTIRIAASINESQPGVWLRKPITSKDIARSLSDLKLTQFATLYRWPGRDVIKSCLGSSRLCTIFFRRAIAIEAATEMSRIPRHQVLLFIEKCIDSHCMKILTKEEGSGYSSKQNSQNEKNNGLFSRLRRKLYSKR